MLDVLSDPGLWLQLGLAVVLAARGFALFVWSPKLPIPGRERSTKEPGG